MLKIDLLAPWRCPRGRPPDWHLSLWRSELHANIHRDSEGWAAALMLIATWRDSNADPDDPPPHLRSQAEGLSTLARVCVLSTLTAGTCYTHLPVTTIMRDLTRTCGVDVMAVVLGFRTDLMYRTPRADELRLQIEALSIGDIVRAGWAAALLWSHVEGDAADLRGWAQNAAWLDARPATP